MSTVVWRFYVGDDQRWRWQTLTPGRVVLSESEASYPGYDSCVSAAAAEGYLFQNAQAGAPRHGGTFRSMPREYSTPRR
jgi:hypothetical protein